jgi:hypothetical protein
MRPDIVTGLFHISALPDHTGKLCGKFAARALPEGTTARSASTALGAHHLYPTLAVAYTLIVTLMSSSPGANTFVESHGGQLWAIPNDGPGATFGLYIPSFAAKTNTLVS